MPRVSDLAIVDHVVYRFQPRDIVAALQSGGHVCSGCAASFETLGEAPAATRLCSRLPSCSGGVWVSDAENGRKK